MTTLERTIADLVGQRTQLDHVGDALRDAARTSQIDIPRLVELLSPLAERNGHPKGNGRALLEELLKAARIDLHSLSRQIDTTPDLAALVSSDYLATVDLSELFNSPANRSKREALEERLVALSAVLNKLVMTDERHLESVEKAIASLGSVIAASVGGDVMHNRLHEMISTMDWASLTNPKQIEAPHLESEAS